ncbi:GYD domain-containing protein [Roseibium sp. HPY-6]|uniref:GYD domain-containing protein n=1 Tax=Roseibium sp. HPY-6 TaxID=3229852 RepID=UPI00338F2963
MSITVLMMIKYENDKKAEMLKSVSDRAEVSKNAVAAMGGKLLHAYGTAGEFDMIFIYEMPDMTSVAANMMLADASGMSKHHKIIPLFSNDEFLAAQKKAGEMTHTYSAAGDK